MENADQSISVKVPENCLTIADGQGTFELLVDIWEDGKLSYSTRASGSIAYSAGAIADFVQVEGLEVDQTSLRMRKEDTAALTARLTPASASERNRVVYASSDESVATVDADGNVTAVGSGTATITAYAVPKMEWVSVQPNGSTTFSDMCGAVPGGMVKAQEITVVVSNESSGGGSGGSGGGSGGISGEGSGGDSSTSSTYHPTVKKPSQGGSVPSISPSNPKPGDTVTVIPKPDDGYKVGKITVTDRNGRPVAVTRKPDGTYTFTQPNGTVTIEVTYVPLAELSEWISPFTDIKPGDWYYEAVQFVQENDLMNGYGNGRFGPNDTLSRAQLAQILFNKEGCFSLMEAISRFDPQCGTKFLTYAVWWIRKFMQETVGIVLADEEVCLSELEEFSLPQVYGKSPEQIFLQAETYAELHDGLRQISARERTYLLYRYGFTDGDEYPIPETAAHFHLTEKRTKKTERAALDDLRRRLSR